MGEKNPKNKDIDALSKISKDRNRTNLLKKYEQPLLAYLVQRIPSWVSSNMLTVTGFVGSLIIMGSFISAKFFDRYWLLLGVLGLVINWFGDSLDGRVAYYRNKSRKWYGFSLDFTVDWISNIITGFAYIIYVTGYPKMLGYCFVVLYGWAMIMALLRYKIVDKYTIDSGFLGPTEVRFVIAFMLILEVFVEGSIVYYGAIICIVLFIVNIIDFGKLLKMADERDIEERRIKENNLID